MAATNRLNRLPPPPATSPTGGRGRAVGPIKGVDPRPTIPVTGPLATPTQQTTRDPRTLTLNQTAMGREIPWHMGPFIEPPAYFYAGSFSQGTTIYLMGGICIGPIRSAQPYADKVAMILSSGSAINPNGTLYASSTGSGDSVGNVKCWIFDGTQTDISVTGLADFDPLAAAEEIHTGLAMAVIRFNNPDGQQNLPSFEFRGEGYRLVFDPADSTFKYTENFALHIREVITNVNQGMAFSSVDDSALSGGFQMAAADCDDPVFLQLPATAPDAAAAFGIGIEAGTYYYTWTAEDANGIETGESPTSLPFMLVSGGSATVTPGTGSSGTAARNIYRSVINDPSAARYRVGRIANNTAGATFHDTMSNATALLQGAAPTNSPHPERYRGGISIVRDATAQSYLDTLTGMCMGTLDMDAGKYQLRIDKPFPDGYEFTVLHEAPFSGAEPNLVRSTIKTYYVEQVDQFNVATIKYFDVNNGFTPASVTLKRRNADGSFPTPKEAVFNFDGIPDRNVAQRLDTQIINATHFMFEGQATRSLIGLQRGDGVRLIAAGVDDFFRITDPPEINESGVFLRGKKYDPASYSNLVQNEDASINGTLADPNAAPPDPTNISIVPGITSGFPGFGEAIIINFTPGVSPFAPRTRVVINDGLSVRALPEQATGPFVIPHPLRGATYTITLLTVTRFGKVSPGVTRTYVATYLPTVPDVTNLAAPFRTLEERGTITFTPPDYPFIDHVDIFDTSFTVPRFVRTVLPSQFASPIDCRAAIQGDGHTGPQTFEIMAYVVSSAASDTAPNATSPGVAVSWEIPVNGIASYTVGNDPRDIILDSSGFLWITCYAAGTIQKIDRATGTVVGTVTVGTKPYGITFGAGSIWVTNFGSDNVKRVDPVAMTVTATIAMTGGSGPLGIIYDGTNIWASAYSRNEVVRISPVSNTITATVTVGTKPCLLYSLGIYIYVSCFGANAVNVLNSSGVVAVVPVGAGPFGLAADDSGFLWVTNYADNSVSKIDPGSNTVVQINVAGQNEAPRLASALPMSFQGGPVDCAFGNGELWVTEAITRQVVRVNVNKNRKTAWVPLPSSPRSIIYDGREFWTPNNLNAASALIPVTAVNPTPGGGTSNAVSFQLNGLDVGPLPS